MNGHNSIITADAGEGSYDLVVSLWENKAGTTMQRRLDKVEYQNVFTVYTGMPTITKEVLPGSPCPIIKIDGINFTPNNYAELDIKKPDNSYFPKQYIPVDAAGKFTVQIPAASNWLPGTYTCYAVDMNTSNASNEITYEVAAATGELHHFEIADISSPWENTPFSVTITAKDAQNNDVPSFSGEVLLSCDANDHKPNEGCALRRAADISDDHCRTRQ